MIQQKALKFILFFFMCYSFVKALSISLDKNNEYSIDNYSTSNGFRANIETIGNYSYLKITIERKETKKVTYSIYYSKNESSTEKTQLIKSSDKKIIKYIYKDQIENGFFMSIENDPKEANFSIIFKATNEKGNDETKDPNDDEEDSDDSKTLKIVLIIVAVIIVVIIIIGVIYYLKIYKPNKNLNDDVNKISFQDEKEEKDKENENENENDLLA